MRARPPFLHLLLLLLATACADSESATGTSPSCKAFEDCADGFYCKQGSCQKDCDDKSSCPQGKQCNARGRCEVVANGCQSAAECQMPSREMAYCMGSTSIESGRSPICGEAFACRYEDLRIECPQGCDAQTGLCVNTADTLCANIQCDAPPEGICKDAMTRVTFDASGRCMQGACDYPRKEESCASGCAAGVCKAALCAASKCASQTPPAPNCSAKKKSVAVTYPDPSICVLDMAGKEMCTFDAAFDDCAYTGAICQMGACKDPVAQSGEVVVTEYMVRPDDAFTSRFDGQWIELANTTTSAIDLNGWSLSYTYAGNTKEHVIANTNDRGEPVALTIAAGGLLLISNSPDPLDGGSVLPAYEWRQIVLENEGTLSLKKPSGDVSDFLYWEPGATMRFHSRQVASAIKATAMGNDLITSWCPNMEATYGASKKQYGTPGTPNTACLSDPCQAFGCTNKPDVYCRDESKAVDFTLANVTCRVSKFQAPYCDFMAFETTCDLAASVCAQGECVPLPANLPGAGEVIFTEFMGDPEGSDALGEWLEVYNTTDRELSLFSLKIEDNEQGGSFTSWLVDARDAKIPAKGYAVFGPNTDPLTNGGIPGMYDLSSKMLKNSPTLDAGTGLSTMTLRLTKVSGELVDEAYYGKQKSGVSQQLDAAKLGSGAVANDAAGGFCAPSNLYNQAFGRGTPGAPNEVCL